MAEATKTGLSEHATSIGKCTHRSLNGTEDGEDFMDPQRIAAKGYQMGSQDSIGNAQPE